MGQRGSNTKSLPGAQGQGAKEGHILSPRALLPQRGVKRRCRSILQSKADRLTPVRQVELRPCPNAHPTLAWV